MLAFERAITILAKNFTVDFLRTMDGMARFAGPIAFVLDTSAVALITSQAPVVLIEEGSH